MSTFMEFIIPWTTPAFIHFLWSLLLTTALALFGFSVFQRVNYYLTCPTSWKVNIGQHETEWPALTLCNINPLRATQIFSNYVAKEQEEDHQSDVTWESFVASNPYINSQQLFLMNSHTAEDMIIRCNTGAVPCSAANFTLILTEQGLCYKLKSDKSVDTIELLLNAEVYEYIEDLSQSSGSVIVYISEPQSVPGKQDTHYHIYPGYHFDVTLGKEELSYLERPYGVCVDQTRDVTSCLSKCYMNRLRSLCYCTPFWFSANIQDSPICDLHKHYSCVKEKMDLGLQFCQCPMSCHSSVYTIQVQAHPRLFSPLDKYMDSASIQDLSHQYRKAQHYQKRLCKKKNSTLVEAFLGVHQGSVARIEQFEADLHKAMAAVKQEYVDLPARIHFHAQVGLKGIQTTLEKGYSSPWRSLEEGELHRIQTTYQTVITTFNRIVTRFRFKTAIEFNLAKLLFTLLDMQLSVNMDLTAETLENMTSLYYALVDGKPLGEFEITPDKRYDAVLVPCQTVFGGAENLHNYYNALSKSLGLYADNIMQLKVVLKDVLITSRYNETIYVPLKDNFIKHSQDIIAATQTFKEQMITRCERHLNEKRKAVYSLKELLHQNINMYEKTVDSVVDVIGLLQTQVFGRIKDVPLSKAERNFSGISLGVAFDEFTNNVDIKGLIDKLDTLIFELRLSYHNLLSPLLSLQDTVLTVWEILFKEESLQNFYTMLSTDVMDMINNPKQTAYFMDIFNSVKMLNGQVENKTGLALERLLVLLNADIPLKEYHTKAEQAEDVFSNLLNTVSGYEGIIILMKELRSMLERILNNFQKAAAQDDLGKDFVKDNLISMRVSKHPEQYFQWTQYTVYTMDALFIEVGSLLVILVGASMLSVMELCDICVTWVVNKLCVHDKPAEDEKVTEKWEKVQTKDIMSASQHVNDMTSPLNLYRKSYVTFKDFNNVNGSEV